MAVNAANVDILTKDVTVPVALWTSTTSPKYTVMGPGINYDGGVTLHGLMEVEALVALEVIAVPESAQGFPPIVLTDPALNTEIASVGTVLTVTPATWDSDTAVTVTRQWQGVYGATVVDYPGATGTSYTAGPEAVGYFTRCAETAVNSTGETVAYSNVTYRVTQA